MDDSTAMADRRGVVQHPIGTVDETDHRHAITGLGGKVLEPCLVVGDEASLQDKILWWIAREGQLGECNQVTTGRVSLSVGGERLVGVALHVTDDGIDLCKADRQRAGSRVRHMIRLRPTTKRSSGTSHAVHIRATGGKRHSV